VQGTGVKLRGRAYASKWGPGSNPQHTKKEQEGFLFGWMDGWLVGWMVGWLAGLQYWGLNPGPQAFFCFCCCLVFETVSLHSWSWPQTHRPPAWASQVLGFQAWGITPARRLQIFLRKAIKLNLRVRKDLKKHLVELSPFEDQRLKHREVMSLTWGNTLSVSSWPLIPPAVK
jgi:hypothetical protein